MARTREIQYCSSDNFIDWVVSCTRHCISLHHWVTLKLSNRLFFPSQNNKNICAINFNSQRDLATLIVFDELLCLFHDTRVGEQTTAYISATDELCCGILFLSSLREIYASKLEYFFMHFKPKTLAEVVNLTQNCSIVTASPTYVWVNGILRTLYSYSW